jgi:hypothetical protein
LSGLRVWACGGVVGSFSAGSLNAFIFNGSSAGCFNAFIFIFTQAFEIFRESGLVQDWHARISKRKAMHKLIAAGKHAHQQKLSATVTQAYNDMTNDDDDSVLGERDISVAVLAQHLPQTCY